MDVVLTPERPPSARPRRGCAARPAATPRCVHRGQSSAAVASVTRADYCALAPFEAAPRGLPAERRAMNLPGVSLPATSPERARPKRWPSREVHPVVTPRPGLARAPTLVLARGPVIARLARPAFAASPGCSAPSSDRPNASGRAAVVSRVLAPRVHARRTPRRAARPAARARGRPRHRGGRRGRARASGRSTPRASGAAISTARPLKASAPTVPAPRSRPRLASRRQTRARQS